MSVFEDYYTEMKNRINFVMIYISEAHANNIWNIGESAGDTCDAPLCIEDRTKSIIYMKEKYGLTFDIYADNMSNDFEKTYCPWPFRYYIIKNNKFLKIGEPDDSQFDICELIEYINKNI